MRGPNTTPDPSVASPTNFNSKTWRASTMLAHVLKPA
jgi:hypothetical protein